MQSRKENVARMAAQLGFIGLGEMADSFKVIGRNILSGDCFRYTPKQPSRKIFNTNWLSANEYQHEIANNYRDYKHQLKTGRIRKGHFRHRKVFFEDQLCVYGEVLQVNRVNFPQSTHEFSQRGNQVNCQLQSFSGVYNNTLRRILAANTLGELEFLTKRQERLYKFKKGLKSTQGISTNCSSHLSTASRTTCTRRREKRCSLGNIRSDRLQRTQPAISGDNKFNNRGVSVDEFTEGEITDDKGNYFLHLASECYDEGFLAHIKYLESIGERNAINNQISKRRKPREFSESENTTSRPQSAGSNVSSNNSVEDFATNTGTRGFISAVKRVLHNRRFGQNPCNSDESAHGAIKRDWKIRVDITRSSSPESLHTSHSSLQEAQDITGSNPCIMSEILNPNEGQRQQNSTSNGSSAKTHHFHDLIENLSNLEISELGSLPKIVLTDFSTSNATVDSAKSHENTISKQQSLDVDISSLSDYNSEARPP